MIFGAPFLLLPGGDVVAFHPSSLRTGGRTVDVIDAADLSTVFTTTAADVNVTTDGDRVGSLACGDGIVFDQGTAGTRLTYRTSGGLHWIADEADGRHLVGNAAARALTQNKSGGFVALALKRDTAAVPSIGANALVFETAIAGASRLLTRVQTTGELRAFGRRIDGETATTADTGSPGTSNFVSIAKADWGAGTLSMSLDGGTPGTGTFPGSGPTSNTASNIAALMGEIATVAFRGRIYAGVFMDAIPTAGEEASVLTWLAAKQGRTL